MFELAVNPVIENLSGKQRITSNALTPIEPVEPKIKTFFIYITFNQPKINQETPLYQCKSLYYLVNQKTCALLPKEDL